MIDKIDGPGGVRATHTIKRPAKSGASGGAGFSKHMDESEETAASGSIGGTNAVSGILGVQEVDDATAHASRGKMRAQDILDRLDDLRLELLAGGISREKLLQLSRIVAARKANVTDPKLAAILDEIDLRAQVELAKHSQR